VERGGAAMTQPARKIDPDAWERRDQRIGRGIVIAVYGWKRLAGHWRTDRALGVALSRSLASVSTAAITASAPSGVRSRCAQA